MLVSRDAPPFVPAVKVAVERNVPLPAFIVQHAEESEINEDLIYREPWYATFFQILIPFLLASIGIVMAGVLLGNVSKWTVYNEINEMFVLVPGMCGLKGNLDMCVAARLCSQASMGHMRQMSDIRKIIIGNLAVVQIQAIVCSMFLATVTVIAKSILRTTFMFQTYATLTASAIITASTSCMILDTMLLVLILFSQRYRCNPDYMATPIVASIGDVTSISLLSFIAAYLYDLGKSKNWVCIAIIVVYVLIVLPLMVLVALRNAYARPVFFYGWISVIGALCISEIAGFLLSASVQQNHGFAVFSPIINGSAGNLGSVQANYMSSLLFQLSEPGKMPQNTRLCEPPHNVLCWGTMYARVSRIALAICIPGSIMQAYLADYLYTLNISIHVLFVVGFVLASFIQLIVLLYTAHLLVHTLWHFKYDPDSSSIPFLTAIGDTLGTCQLALMFYILQGTIAEYIPAH